MDYWRSVLDEVLHKEENGRSFLFTNQGRLGKIYVDCENELARPRVRNDHKHYYLGAPYLDIYLTRREAETMFWMMQNYTISHAAHKMHLSARTVEFYLKNLKLKFHCKTKNELVKKLLQTNLLQQLEKDDLKIMQH